MRGAPPATTSNLLTTLASPQVFQLITVACATITIVLSWPLWQVRPELAPVPLLPLPSLPCGIALLAALALAVVRPGAGLLAYSVVYAYAVATDWTRLQPAMVSFAFLLAAGIPGTGGCTLARVHVITLWLYAGINKLLSPNFWAVENPWILYGLMSTPPEWMGSIYPELVIIGEAGLGLAALFPATRWLAAYWALVLHGSIFLALSPIGHGWNPTVWPWNVALAFTGIYLIRPWRGGVLQSIRAQPVAIRFAALFLAVFPLFAQFGIGDPYLAHNLYSENTPLGYVCNANGPQPLRPGLADAGSLDDIYANCRTVDFFSVLNVPEPPEHAFIAAYFTRTCTPAETLLIYERRPFYTRRGQKRWIIPCPTTGTPSL